MSVAAGVGPVAGVALRGRPDLGARAGPEPAVLVGGLQVGSVAASEVTLAARCPDEAHVAARDPLLHELVLLLTTNNVYLIAHVFMTTMLSGQKLIMVQKMGIFQCHFNH